MKYQSVFITGANRGIGLELVRSFLAKDDPPRILFATYRSPYTLQELKVLSESSKKTKVVLIKMDVTIQDEINQAKKVVESTLGNEGLSLLINNAGFLESLSFDQITIENMQKHFRTNTIGPLMVLKTLLPLLEKSKSQRDGFKSTIVNISSGRGSIGHTGAHPYDYYVPSYKMSKACQNMMTRVVSMNLRDRGILVVAMNTGWVRTEMGDIGLAELSPEESASALVQSMGELTPEQHGCFVNRFGVPIPF